MPRVSVILPVYNGERYLGEAIESVLAQTFKDYELILVNDGSGDRTGVIARRYLRRWPDRIVYIEQENAGVAVARNRGIASARGEFLAVLDADDLFLPEKLERQVRFLDGHPEVGALSTWFEVIDAAGNWMYEIRRTEGAVGIAWFLHFFNYLGGNSQLMFRRTLVESVGGYEQEHWGYEDRQIYLKLMGSTRFHVLPEILMRYRSHGENTSLRRRRDIARRGPACTRRHLTTTLGIAVTEEDVEEIRRFFTKSGGPADLGRVGGILHEAYPAFRRWAEGTGLFSEEEIRSVKGLLSRSFLRELAWRTRKKRLDRREAFLLGWEALRWDPAVPWAAFGRRMRKEPVYDFGW